MDGIEIDAMTTLEMDRIERWRAFKRLQELSIPCRCTCDQPLQVKVSTATAAIQVWSVIQQFTLSREASVERLKRCWQQQSIPR